MGQARQNIWDMFDGKSKASPYYDIIMMVVIVVSLVPLIFKQETTALLWIDRVTVTIRRFRSSHTRSAFSRSRGCFEPCVCFAR